MAVTHDVDELGTQLRQIIRNDAAEYMPTPVPLYVIETSKQQRNGYVTCELDGQGGQRVRCIVPTWWDLSPDSSNVARVVLWALPLLGKASGSQYIALWPSWNGQDESRDIRTTGYAYGNTTSVVVTLTLTALYDVVLVDASAGNVIVNLPVASTVRGKHYWVKKVDNSGNSVTIDGNSGETIDGSGTKSTSTQYAGWHIVSNGSAWYIIGTF